MKNCWTQPNVEFEGRFWQLRGVAMEPKPFQKPHPPIWFGGSHPAALQRAVRHGDAFMGAGSTSTAAFAEQVTTVRAEMARAERQTFPIAKRVYIVVDDDATRARERAEAGLVGIYGDFGRRLTGVAVFGAPKDCVDGLLDVASAGAETIVINPIDDEFQQMERLAADVLPHIR
jgi:alkanesulfonate monooxygenase SsuD/methylene tetrahydromethanopterin reductase-like flavin-dependent oxidoreductase (luciferase family)